MTNFPQTQLMNKKMKANLYENSRFQFQENYRETVPYFEQPDHQCLQKLHKKPFS